MKHCQKKKQRIKINQLVREKDEDNNRLRPNDFNHIGNNNNLIVRRDLIMYYGKQYETLSEEKTWKRPTITFNELKQYDWSQEYAKSLGYVVVGKTKNICKNCGERTHNLDFCDYSCFLDWQETA